VVGPPLPSPCRPGLIGVMGETAEFVDGWVEGVIGERLVGEATDRPEMFKDREVEDWGLLSVEPAVE
jgi:hypothetical protein